MNIKQIEMPKSVSECIYNDNDFNRLGLVSKEYDDDSKVLGYIDGEAYADYVIKNDKIKVIIIPKSLVETIANARDIDIIVSDNPKTTFFHIHEYLLSETDFYLTKKENRIDETAVIDETVVLGESNIQIGAGCVIKANVVINSNTIIGDNVLIHEGVVIGTHPFYYYRENEIDVLVNPAGGVHLDNNSVIHANSVIEAGVFNTPTYIGVNSKVDASCHLSHDNYLYNDVMMAAGCATGGFVTIGEHTFVGLNSSVAHTKSIGANCMVSMGSAVTKNIPDNSHFSGNFAIDHEVFTNNLKDILRED